MRTRSKTVRTLAGAAALASAFACASAPETPAGYWEGSGTAMEVPMQDEIKRLERRAEFELWFNLSEDGEASGEIELIYGAELTVEDLPNVTAPVPGGSVSFQPKVGGKLTDLDPRRTFPLVGSYQDGELTLEIATAESERPPLEFTLRADAGISGSVSVGPVGVGGLGGDASVIVHKIDMTPFSPFSAPVPVQKRAGGPFAARFEESSQHHAIDWSARQVRQ